MYINTASHRNAQHGPSHPVPAQRVCECTIKERSYHSSYLISFILTECAVICRSYGKLGRFTLHPIQTKWGQMGWVILTLV